MEKERKISASLLPLLERTRKKHPHRQSARTEKRKTKRKRVTTIDKYGLRKCIEAKKRRKLHRQWSVGKSDEVRLTCGLN